MEVIQLLEGHFPGLRAELREMPEQVSAMRLPIPQARGDIQCALREDRIRQPSNAWQDKTKGEL